MKVLEINSGKAGFIVDKKGTRSAPEDLSRDDLLNILNRIYEEKEEKIEIPEDDEIKKIDNPIEEEVVLQIIHKIKDFKDNIPNIRSSIESNFPDLKDTAHK